MTIPTANIGFSHIQTEFGGAAPIGLAEYYGKGGAPGSGTIAVSMFSGASAYQTATMIAGQQAGSSSGYTKSVYGSLTPALYVGGVLVNMVALINFNAFGLTNPVAGISAESGTLPKTAFTRYKVTDNTNGLVAWDFQSSAAAYRNIASPATTEWNWTRPGNHFTVGRSYKVEIWS